MNSGPARGRIAVTGDGQEGQFALNANQRSANALECLRKIRDQIVCILDPDR